jgi:hypothetical protein
MPMAENMQETQAEVTKTRNRIMRRLRRKRYIPLEPPARATLYSSPSQLPIVGLSEALCKPRRPRASSPNA